MCDKIFSEDPFVQKYCHDKCKTQESRCLVVVASATGFVTFFSRDTNLNSVTLDNINLDDNGSDYCDPETINQVRLIGCYNKYKQRKASKKSRWRIIKSIGIFLVLFRLGYWNSWSSK